MKAVTCIMPTANRREFVPAAIRLFLAQDYEEKELVIVDDGTDRVEDVVPEHPRIRYLALPQRARLGTKRNLACEAAQGEIIVHWDDDDWHAPCRVSLQVEALEQGEFDLCGLERAFFVNGQTSQAWEYVHPPSTVPWVCGATLCYRKSFWSTHRFADVAVGEDSRFVFSNRGARIGALEQNGFFVARIHERNTCRKWPRDARWQPRLIADVRALLGSGWQKFFGGPGGLPEYP